MRTVASMIFYPSSSTTPVTLYVSGKDCKCFQGHSEKNIGFVNRTTERRRLKDHFKKSSYFPDEDRIFSSWFNSLYQFQGIHSHIYSQSFYDGYHPVAQILTNLFFWISDYLTNHSCYLALLKREVFYLLTTSFLNPLPSGILCWLLPLLGKPFPLFISRQVFLPQIPLSCSDFPQNFI